MNTSLLRHLLKILIDHEFHSGEELGKALQVSRAAVWKQIKLLEKLGLQFHAVQGRGYQLIDQIELLDKNKILERVDSHTQQQIKQFEILFLVDSTNNFLLRAHPKSIAICLAEQQEAGRGRFGRQWLSTFAKNILFSLSWDFNDASSKLAGLSLVVGIAVIRALKSFGIVDTGIKWPNDLIHQGKKFGGVLIDIVGDAMGPSQVVIGIGINVSLSEKELQKIDKPITDLFSMIQQPLSRNHLIAAVLNHLVPILLEFVETGFVSYLDEWQHLDILQGKCVTLKSSSHPIKGIVRRVDEQGSLVLECDGVWKTFTSGEVTLS